MTETCDGRLSGIGFHRAGSGEPLLLIAPFWRAWDPVLPRLAAACDVIAVDLPGFGAAPAPAGISALGVAGMADALSGLLSGLGLDAVHVAGNSLGASVAAELAKRGRATTLTLFAPVGLGTPGENRRTARRLRLVRRASGLASVVVSPAARTSVGRVILAGAGMHLARPWRHEREAMIVTVQQYLRAPGFEPAFRSALADRPDGLERIACPTLVVWGTRDRIAPARQADRWVDRIRGARLELLRRVGHVPMSDDAEAVTRLLLANAVREA